MSADRALACDRHVIASTPGFTLAVAEKVLSGL